MDRSETHAEALCRIKAHLDSLQIVPTVPVDDLKRRIREILGLLPRFPDQFLYIVNYTQGKVIHAEGFEQVLGYPDDRVDLPLIYESWHPDDAPYLARITELTSANLTKLNPPIRPFEATLTVDYRVRKANGDHIKVQRQTTVFSVDERTNRTVSTFSLCRDISNLKASDRVGWQWEGRGAGNIVFPELYGQMDYRPTARELEVIRRLAQGHSSKTIADLLHISTYTVNTHRSNLLRRTGVRNTAELIKLAKEQGWM